MILLVEEYNLPLTGKFILLFLLFQHQMLLHINHVFQACGATVDPVLMLIILGMMTHKLL